MYNHANGNNLPIKKIISFFSHVALVKIFF
jgi:hypothetical protein